MLFKSSSLVLASVGLAGLVLAGTGVASATIVEANSSSITGYTVTTANDILLGTANTGGSAGGSASYTGGSFSPGGSTFSALTNGLAPANPVNTGQEFGAQGGTSTAPAGTVITFALANATNIGSIVTYTGWQDAGRVNQNYTLSYSTNNGSSYTPLTTVNYSFNYPSYAGTPADTMVQLTSISGPLITGATDLQFSFFYPSVQNNGVGYSEIAAYPVPEPASLGLMAAAGMGLLLLRKKRISA
ncbi:MAG: PEP-CTERM sorting domain-containing protein [Phycisphaerae bacterium]